MDFLIIRLWYFCNSTRGVSCIKCMRSSEKLLAIENEIWLEFSQRIRVRQAFLFNFKLLYSTEDQVQCISFYHVILIGFLSFSLLYSKPYIVRVQPDTSRIYAIFFQLWQSYLTLSRVTFYLVGKLRIFMHLRGIERCWEFPECMQITKMAAVHKLLWIKTYLYR